VRLLGDRGRCGLIEPRDPAFHTQGSFGTSMRQDVRGEDNETEIPKYATGTG
jgi:hypothetical protein